MGWARRQIRASGAAMATAALLAPSAGGVLLASGDGTQNTTAPVDDPGFAHVGRRGGLTAVYLGDGWVLTANHVGTGTVTFGATTTEPVAGSEVRLENGDGTFADLKLFAVYPPPELPLLPVRADPLSGGEAVVMVGNGRDRGPATSWDPNGPPPPGPIDGWEWASSRSLRWGTNVVDGFPVDPVGDTLSFYTTFDEGYPGDEAQAANGDSGGAVFVHDGVEWQLAGILFAIGVLPEQPPQTALYGNLTYAADLSFYYDQIVDTVALPEPATLPGLLVGTLLLAVLRPRRPQGSGRPQRAGEGRARRGGRAAPRPCEHRVVALALRRWGGRSGVRHPQRAGVRRRPRPGPAASTLATAPASRSAILPRLRSGSPASFRPE